MVCVSLLEHNNPDNLVNPVKICLFWVIPSTHSDPFLDLPRLPCEIPAGVGLIHWGEIVQSYFTGVRNMSSRSSGTHSLQGYAAFLGIFRWTRSGPHLSA
jgi:hypothetical protein